jgi:hypothetical protein
MLKFGEKVEGYKGLVFNEREIRGAAGIVFLLAFITFMINFMTGNNEPMKLVISLLLFDFSVRIFINPKYAPSMVLARWMVNNQTPEYTGAKQKLLPWVFGLILASIMFYLVVLSNVRGPLNILICTFCLSLFFIEAVFGICVGCKIYHFFYKQKARYCPGEACDLSKNRTKIQQLDNIQKMIFLISILLLIYITFKDIFLSLIQN